MRLTGFDAIEYAEKEGLTLHKAADSIDDAAEGLTIAEAGAIADEDPDLIWLEIPEDEYYGEPRNMEPGTTPTRPPKLAGQRPDELLPGQNSGRRSRDKAQPAPQAAVRQPAAWAARTPPAANLMKTKTSKARWRLATRTTRETPRPLAMSRRRARRAARSAAHRFSSGRAPINAAPNVRRKGPTNVTIAKGG